jgi:hypothetical protein
VPPDLKFLVTRFLGPSRYLRTKAEVFVLLQRRLSEVKLIRSKPFLTC